MVAEGVIALIWAAAGCSIYKITGGLSTGLNDILANGQSAAIYDVCIKTMGGVGVALAMIGVIVCPITSGDTAFRSARLVLADWFKVDQNKMQKRLMLCVPLLAVGAFCRTSGLCDRMEILQLDKPDTCNDRSVDSKYVSVPREEELLDHSSSCNIYECRFHDLFLLRRRVSGTFYEGCLSGRNYPGSSIPWNLYPCDKEPMKA